MFLGEHNHTIDNKGRIIIPSKFREELGDQFIITCGFEKCLTIYPMDEWEEYAEKIASLPLTSKDVRAFSRLIYSKAVETSCDKMGRIVLPQNLREYASLNKDAVINGNFKTVEIWNRENWGNYSDNASHNFEEQAEKLSELF